MALKNALKAVFPSAQQQLCIYHVNANVNARIRSKWKSEDGGSNNEADDNEPEVAEGNEDLLKARARADDAAVEVDDDLAARAAEQEIAKRSCAALLPAADPQSRKGIFRA
ncbi:hypothetical protein M431DRAFT_478516 [Trichoderma harzianum CBS 226.95]|uniref:MULE transposase domain-containing protein n=1 Tax=Trichoderma harzianum CBS 226.95 TaxID=983964 RepID=A0A2T4AQV1_TRIHA|nr:hypothetical protein M431DRAFT_478516 [Trichoderma harzianum CBS 226.95]PTB59441.1 hypothetical protein M431DRAFT_478516 [Trichoderma harzianum CBS 226.95]